MVLTVTVERGIIHFVPALDDQRRIVWTCESGEGLTPTQLPSTCRSPSR
jgi:hypothetical protein